jgi:hypothetical protein
MLVHDQPLALLPLENGGPAEGREITPASLHHGILLHGGR